MMPQYRFDDKWSVKAIKLVRSFWPIIVSIGILIWTLSWKNRQLEAHEQALILNSANHTLIDDRFNKDEQRIVKIETNMEILPEMRSDIKTLLRRSR